MMLVGLLCMVLSYFGTLAYLVIRQFVLPGRWRKVYSPDVYVVILSMLLFAVLGVACFGIGSVTSAWIGVMCWVILFASFLAILVTSLNRISSRK